MVADLVGFGHDAMVKNRWEAMMANLEGLPTTEWCQLTLVTRHAPARAGLRGVGRPPPGLGGLGASANASLM